MLNYYVTRLPQDVALGVRSVPTLRPRHHSIRFQRRQTWANMIPQWTSVIGLRHTADTVILTAELPGFTPESLTIEVSRDRVLIQGQHDFQRLVQLPIGVDHSRATAELTDGLLTLTMPKLATHRSTIVPVTIGGNSLAAPLAPDPAMDLSPEAIAVAPPETADPIPADPWQ